MVAAMAKPSEQQPLWTRDFILISLASLFIFLGFQMLLPVLPVYATKLGGTKATAGMVIGVFTFSAVIIRPITGRLLDQYGRRGIYLAGLILFTLCVFAYNWVPGILSLLILRFVHGFGWGAASTASSTIVSDIIPKSRLGEGMGYFGLTGTLAMAIAPALGLGIMNSLGFGWVYNISALAVLMCIFMSLPIHFHRPEVNAQIPRGPIFEKAAIFPGIIVFFVTMTYGAVVSFIALYAEQQGVPNIGPFFTAYALALLVSRPFFGRLSDRRGYTVAVLPGILAVAIAMLVLYFAQSLTSFILAGFVYGIGFGAVQPALQAMSVRDMPPARRGAATGTFFLGFDLGIGVSSMIWGAVAEITGYQTIYVWAVVPTVIAAVLYLAKGKVLVK